MVQRGEHARLTAEAREALGIVSNRRREDLDGDVTPERQVAGAIDLAHRPGTERADDLERAEARPRSQHAESLQCAGAEAPAYVQPVLNRVEPWPATCRRRGCGVRAGGCRARRL